MKIDAQSLTDPGAGADLQERDRATDPPPHLVHRQAHRYTATGLVGLHQAAAQDLRDA
jgi:hypothetical protein